jgi:hypothetical protein
MFLSAMMPSAGPTALLSAGSQKVRAGALSLGDGRAALHSAAQHRHTTVCARLRKTIWVKRLCSGP